MRDAGKELIFLFHEAAGADDWLNDKPVFGNLRNTF